jgi:hypothetical protein
MTFRLTQEAAERPRRTLHAYEIFHMNARTIAAACASAGPDEVVVAAVAANHTLAGVWTFRRSELTERVRDLDSAAWTLVFSPGTTRIAIEERCLELARIAFQRWETIRKWDSKHS